MILLSAGKEDQYNNVPNTLIVFLAIVFFQSVLLRIIIKEMYIYLQENKSVPKSLQLIECLFTA